MTRTADLLFAVFGLLLLSPIMFSLIIIGLIDTGSPLFFQKRLGKDQKLFRLVKFRTMRPGTLSLATHLVDPGAVTKFGRFLRRSKLDELPQLWNVLRGEMSLVGPRPCLPSQVQLIAARQTNGVFVVRPGITGLAQTQGIDMSNPQRLAEVDAEMIRGLSLLTYLRILLLTLIGRGAGDRVVSN